MRRSEVAIIGLGAVFITSIASATLFRSPGISCVQEGSSAHIVYNSASVAVNNDSSSSHTFHCSGTAISSNTLQSVTVEVIDQNPGQAVECTAFNGSFSTSAASVGSAAALQSLALDLPDAGWTDARITCLVPKVDNGRRSGISSIVFNTL